MAKKPNVAAKPAEAATTAQPTKQEVTIKLTGGMRRGAITVEALPIPLQRRPDGSFTGKKTITLEPPTVSANSVVKGGRLAVYDFEVTINGVTKHIEGVIKDGVKSDDVEWGFEAFKL